MRRSWLASYPTGAVPVNDIAVHDLACAIIPGADTIANAAIDIVYNAIYDTLPGPKHVDAAIAAADIRRVRDFQLTARCSCHSKARGH